MTGKRNIIFKSLLFLAISIVISTCILLAQQVPKTEKEIPIFPGAVRDLNAESEMKEQAGEEADPSLQSGIHKVYKTGASAEEVFGFYLKAIGGKEGVSYEDPRGLQPGAVSQVWYELRFWKDQDFKDIVYDTSTSGEWMKMKQNLEKNRKPYKPGMWIHDGRFTWVTKEANNDLNGFILDIEDTTFLWNLESAPTDNRRTTTRFEIIVATEKSEEAMTEETDEETDRAAEALSKSLKSKPPTEKDLGVPIYPGAKLDAESSAGMSIGNDYRMYIYLSDDPPSKVAAFYEQQLKVKPFPAGKDHYMFALKGNLPIPEEGLSVEPNTMFGGRAKTVISIQKMVREND
jgi:hypothetical protein